MPESTPSHLSAKIRKREDGCCSEGLHGSGVSTAGRDRVRKRQRQGEGDTERVIDI